MIWKLAAVVAGIWWFVTLLRRLWPFFADDLGPDDRVFAVFFTVVSATIGAGLTVLLGVIAVGIGQWVVS